jgi:hypothetical protein
MRDGVHIPLMRSRIDLNLDGQLHRLLIGNRNGEFLNSRGLAGLRVGIQTVEAQQRTICAKSLSWVQWHPRRSL